jgi:hypothetical protein
MSITHCGCVFVVLDIQHAVRMLRTVIDGSCGYTIFFHFASYTARFSARGGGLGGGE